MMTVTVDLGPADRQRLECQVQPSRLLLRDQELLEQHGGLRQPYGLIAQTLLTKTKVQKLVAQRQQA